MSVEVVAPFNVPEAEEVVYMTEEEDDENLEDFDEGNDIEVEGDDVDSEDEEADITCPQCGTDVIIDDVTHKCPLCKYTFKLTKHGLLEDGFVQDKIEYEDDIGDESDDDMDVSDEEESSELDESESEFDYCDSDDEYVPRQ